MRFVSIEEHDDVAVVRVDRPPANAMDPGLLADAVAATEELAAAEPGAVVLTGRPGFFSAGADLKVVPTLDADGQRAMVARDLAALPSSAYAATKRRLRAPRLALAARLQAGEADSLGDAWTDADTASRAAAILRGG
jgi:enoyl-CoA hydratase/carnithine racemase